MKLFTTAEFREIYDQYGREKISFTRMVELINEKYARKNNINFYNAMLFAVHDVTGRVLRPACAESMMDDFIKGVVLTNGRPTDQLTTEEPVTK